MRRDIQNSINPTISLQWRHNEHDDVSNHQPNDCLLNLLFGRRSKKTSKLRVTGLCAGNSQGTGEFPTQMASNSENVSIWWRHHVGQSFSCLTYIHRSSIRTIVPKDTTVIISKINHTMLSFTWWLYLLAKWCDSDLSRISVTEVGHKILHYGMI